jgi:DNA-binding IclR family transcriptional regulator
MSTTGGKYSGTQAVRRAIALLKSFSDGRQEWQVSELAEANGLNSSTTYRLLSALEDEGLVTRRDDNGRYRLGPEMIALGGCALRSHSLRAAARPALQRLAAETGEAATLETLSDGAMIVIDEVSSQHLVGMSQDVGARLPVHATSTGKALLAYASEDEVEAALGGALEPLTEQTVTSKERLLRELEAVRGRGYAVAVDELELGFVAIAGPVFGYDGRVMAAVSVGGPGMRLTPEKRGEMAARVMEAARSISAEMGYRA